MDTIRVLHIEDSERDAELILRRIRAAGYWTVALRVEDEASMAAALVEQRWDVILSDFNMPRFNGLRALEVLQQHGEDIPFIVLSGTLGEEAAVAMMKAGAADYVMKDNPNRLVPAILREIADAGHRRARRSAEAQLIERERMLSTAQRIAHLGSWERNFETDTLWWSQELYALLGRSPDYQPSVQGSVVNVAHPEDREAVASALERALRSGAVADLEHRIVRADGEVRWVATRMEPELGNDGKPRRLFGTFLDITERKQSDEEIRFQAHLLDTVEQAVIATDIEGRIVYWNRFAETLYGWSAAEVAGQLVQDVMMAGQSDAQIGEMIAQLMRGETWKGELWAHQHDGTNFWVHTTLSHVFDPQGSLMGFVGLSFDVTERKQAELALRRSENEYRNLFESANDAVIIFDAEDEQIIDANVRATDMYAPSGGSLVDVSLRELIGDGPMDLLKRGVRSGDEGIQGVEAVLQRPHRARVDLLINASLVGFRNREVVLSIHRDVTAQKELERQLAHQALHDALTGVANRALFEDRMTHALERAREDQTDVAILMLDLDRFKLINETLGHDVGDRLLIRVAERLRACVRDGDTIGRFGGDEFVVLVENVVNMREVTFVAERISNMLQEPVVLDGHDIVVTASIGIVTSDAGKVASEGLLRNADVAMYRAKDAGRARYVVFDPSMNATMLERLTLESELRQALARDELHVHYQPTVELESGRVIGMEALVRWIHPTRGSISPGEFIPLAEEAGLIRLVDQCVLRAATSQLAHWRHRFPDGQRLAMNVNLSAQGFQHPDLVHDVATALDESGIDPADVQLEITESVIMTDAGATQARLRQLKELGVRIAIDDFGTGYSSLSYLKRFPVDLLKIDKSFIDGLGTDAEDTAIVEAVISLSRALGMDVTAEGVETELAVRQLRQLGCAQGQGYFFSRPLPPEAFDELWASDCIISPGWQELQAS